MNYFLRVIRVCAFLCVVLPAAQAAEPAPQGSLVIVGGALRADNAEIWQRVVKLAGGAGARIAVIPAAAANPVRSGANLAGYLNHYGASAFVVPLAVRLKDHDYRRDAEDAALAASIRQAGGVYFAGGDQAMITQALVRADGSRTAALEAIWDVYRRGGVIAGSSAGAAIMSSTMFRDAMNPVQVMKGVMREGKEIDRGLGFVGDQLFIDQHFLKRGRVGRMLALMLAKGYKVGLGVDENTAAIIHGSEIEIVGGSGALLVDLRQATQEAGPVNVRNVRISYLDNGDRYDLAKLKGQVLAAKQARGELKFRQPGFAPELEYMRPAYTDILGENTILRALTQLVDGPRDHVRGIAFDLEQLPGAPVADPAPELGFEFILRRDEHTRGWDSAGLDDHDYSIFDARLDVRPVRLKTPFYQAW